jgi:hypothetical protein
MSSNLYDLVCVRVVWEEDEGREIKEHQVTVVSV